MKHILEKIKNIRKKILIPFIEEIKKWIKLLMPLLALFFGNDYIVQPFQEQEWKEQHKLERKNEKQQEAIKYFEELSDLMDKRLFLTRQYLWAIDTGKDSNMQKRNGNLQNFLFEWNTQLNKNIVKVAIYFQSKEEYKFDFEKCTRYCSQENKSLCECNDIERKKCYERHNYQSSIEAEWECNIHHNFRCIQASTLRQYRYSNPSDKNLRATAQDQINCLNQRIEQFNRHILQHIFRETDSL